MAKSKETKRTSDEEVIVTGRPLVEGDNFTSEEHAIDSIVTTWNGGEHVLAGARASELIYGAGKKPNQKVMDTLIERIPGVERYISAPNSGMIVETVGEQTGDPLARQPENRAQRQGGQNLSTDEAKAEQNEVDKTLEAGRLARDKAAGGEDNPLGSTELNPSSDVSNRDPLDHDGDGRRGGSKYRKP